MRYTDESAANPLRELAGRIKSLSFREMLALAGAIATDAELGAVGGITSMAARLLAAADSLETA